MEHLENRTQISTLQESRPPVGRVPRNGPTTVAQNCATCNKEFEARAAEVKRGNGHFCSLQCFASRARPAKKPNTICSWCGASFYKKESAKRAVKHGHYFCGRPCKEAAQSDPSFGISPPHYGTGGGAYDYRSRALEAHGSVCSGCGYDRYPEVLHVHHINKNRQNNELSNLAVLCPTCHREVHVGHRTV